jgi:hypothetical protein
MPSNDRWIHRETQRLTFDTTRTTQKTTPLTILLCRKIVFTEPLPSKDTGIQRQSPQTLLSYDTDRIENEASSNLPTLVCIRCHGNMYTEPLPSNDTRGKHTDTQAYERNLWSTPLRWGQVPRYTYNFHIYWFRHSKVNGGGTQT